MSCAFLRKKEQSDEQIEIKVKVRQAEALLIREQKRYQWVQNLMLGGGNIFSTFGLRQMALTPTQPHLMLWMSLPKFVSSLKL